MNGTNAMPPAAGAIDGRRTGDRAAIRLADATIACFVLGAMIFGPWGTDEGWNWLIVANHAETGRFSYVLSNGDAEYSLMRPWLYLLSLLAGDPAAADPLRMRLAPAALAFATWLLLRRLVVTRHGADPGALAGAAAVFVACVGLLVNLRPDAVSVFAAAAGLFLVSAPAAGLAALAGAGAAAAAASACHPLGLTAGAYVIIAAAARWPGAPARGRWAILAAAAAATALFAALALWGSSPAAFIDNFRQAAQAGTHSRPWTEEWWRYLRLLYVAPVAALALFAGVAGFVARARPGAGGLAAVLVTALLLLVNPAKWEQYAVIWLPVAVLGAAALGAGGRGRAAVAGGCMVVAALATASDWRSGEAVLAGLTGRTLPAAVGESVRGRLVLTDPALHPFLAGYGGLTPLDATGIAPEVAVVGRRHAHYLALLDDGARYRRTASFAFDGREYDVLVRAR